MGHEQHFTRDVDPIRAVLSWLPIAGRSVLELGAGRGALTSLLLERDPEPRDGLRDRAGPLHAARSAPHAEEDFTRADLSVFRAACWIATPPYETLRFIHSAIDSLGVRDVVLLVSEKKYEALFRDFEVGGAMTGADFDPPSTGTHYIVWRGFR